MIAVFLGTAGYFLINNQNSRGKTSAENVENEVIAKNDIVQNEPATLLAVGDLLLDRYIKREIDRKGADYSLANVKSFLSGNDLALANLEGSFTDFKPRKLDPNNTSFTFDPALAAMLKASGFNLVNLANNHVQDFGKDGFAQSRTYLEKNGINYFGDFYNGREALIKEIRGIKIAFVGYNEFGDPAIAGTLEKIKKAKGEADFVVVYAHWGAEYETDFWPGSQERGRQFIDAGADVVLGGHPHVVQPIEIYKNKPIFYSLGNFLFDQIFSDQVRHGLAVKITFNKDRVVYELTSTEMKNFQVSLSDKEKNTAVLSWLSQKSIAPQEIKNEIAMGKFEI